MEKRIMLHEVKGLHGITIQARDGEIGRVDEILFDDEHWTVRYLIADTGNWLTGRKVLISPIAFGLLDWDHRTLQVNLTRAQVENSPGVEADEPVSRQWESGYSDYYDWPNYWGALGVWGPYSHPGGLFAQRVGKADPHETPDDLARDHVSAHLRSTKEVTGYGLSATDGHLGHLQDFLVDDVTWRIRYLAVNTQDWWPGKKVLLPPDWIKQVDWLEHSVTVRVSRDQVRNAPAWEPGQPISPVFEEQLSYYYSHPNPSDSRRQSTSI